MLDRLLTAPSSRLRRRYGTTALTRYRAAAATLLTFLSVATPASAGDPIMPLDQVRSGMQCTGYSVVRGTEPAEFGVEVLDVIDGDPTLEGPRILVGVSGPAVERTGIGPGFSGTPVYCPDGAGVSRVIGAISESIGEYGGKVALATPIEAVLSVNPVPPGPRRSAASALSGPASGLRPPAVAGVSPGRLPGKVLPLSAPLTVTGLSAPVGRIVAAAGRKAGRIVLAAPAGPAGTFPVQSLRPGSSLAVGLSSGDLAGGAVGTVAYVDGPNVWGYGHGFDNAGARSLLLQDAYVFRVINNPNTGGEFGSTYKLAVAGHTLGTITHDATNAVAGRLGATPPTIPVHVYAKDGDTGRTRESHMRVADETAVHDPGGSAPVSFIAPLAVTQAASTVLGSAPGKSYATMCAQIVLAEVRRPVRICNRYVAMGGGEGELGLSNLVADRAGADVADALAAIDAFKLGTLHIKEVTARITLRRGIRQAYLRSVRAPKRVRPGQRIRVSIGIHRVRGSKSRGSFIVRVPRDIEPGSHRLVLQGTPADSGGGDLLAELTEIFEGGDDEPEDGPGATRVSQVVAQMKRVERFDGVYMSIVDPNEDEGDEIDRSLGLGRPGGSAVEAFRDKHLRISGRASTSVRVTR